MKRFTTLQAMTVPSNCLTEIMKCGWFRKMSAPKKMNENMKGVSIARGKLLFPIDVNSTCKSNVHLESPPESTAMNQAYLQCAFLMPEALSSYTGNR